MELSVLLFKLHVLPFCFLLLHKHTYQSICICTSRGSFGFFKTALSCFLATWSWCVCVLVEGRILVCFYLRDIFWI